MGVLSLTSIPAPASGVGTSPARVHCMTGRGAAGCIRRNKLEVGRVAIRSGDGGRTIPDDHSERAKPQRRTRPRAGRTRGGSANPPSVRACPTRGPVMDLGQAPHLADPHESPRFMRSEGRAPDREPCYSRATRKASRHSLGGRFCGECCDDEARESGRVRSRSLCRFLGRRQATAASWRYRTFQRCSERLRACPPSPCR
jgi:hypothetical protein